MLKAFSRRQSPVVLSRTDEANFNTVNNYITVFLFFYLPRFSIDSLTSRSTVGYPSDSLASCTIWTWGTLIYSKVPLNRSAKKWKVKKIVNSSLINVKCLISYIVMSYVVLCQSASCTDDQYAVCRPSMLSECLRVRDVLLKLPDCFSPSDIKQHVDILTRCFKYYNLYHFCCFRCVKQCRSPLTVW